MHKATELKPKVLNHPAGSKMNKHTLDKYRRNAEKCIELLTQDDIDNARQWYTQAHDIAKEIATDTGYTIETVAQVIAVLSPGVAWKTNVKDATNLCKAHVNGFPYDVVVSTYGANKSKAIRILDGTETLQPTAAKTYAFFNNILYPFGSTFITVDRHAAKALLGEMDGGSKPLTKKQYEKLAQGYAILAKEYNLTPMQYQAVVWVGYKRLVNR